MVTEDYEDFELEEGTIIEDTSDGVPEHIDDVATDRTQPLKVKR